MASASLTLELSPEQNLRLQRLAQALSRPEDALLREALDLYLDQADKREQFRLETIDAWNSFQEDGLHLSEEEAHTWMERLAGGERAEVPKCHR